MMRVVVCTIVHHTADARIYHRQIRALLDAGHEVTYVAPVDPQDFCPERTWPSLQLKAVPRASGRRRTGAILAARSVLAKHAAKADLLLIHDPELLLALPARRRRPPVIWDVHEDTAAALSTKPWRLPRPLRTPAAVAVHTAERMAERYVHLILAERARLPGRAVVRRGLLRIPGLRAACPRRRVTRCSCGPSSRSTA
jgi:hypothetical protein